MDLDNLLKRVKEGDNDAFEKLYLETRKGVFAFLYTYLHNYHDTEDAMQTVYLKIKQNIHLYDTKRPARAWILTIAKNHALNELKKRGRTEDLEGVDTQCYDEMDTSFALTDLMQQVLTEEENRIIVFHVLWGYKHREIARILDMPTGTVTSKYKRALAKLKERMKEENL